MNARPAMQTLRILWFSLFSSTSILAALLIGGVQAEDAELPSTFPLTMAMVAIFMSLASAVLPARLQRRALQDSKLSVVEEPDPSSAFSSYRGELGKRRVFAEPGLARETALRVGQTATIIGMALAESVAIFGFVVGYFGFDLVQAAPFFVVSWGLMLWRFPRAQTIFAPLEVAYQATLLDEPLRKR